MEAPFIDVLLHIGVIYEWDSRIGALGLMNRFSRGKELLINSAHSCRGQPHVHQPFFYGAFSSSLSMTLLAVLKRV